MIRTSRPEYESTAIEIYLEQGKPALIDYLRKIEVTKHTESYSDKVLLEVFCPSCGHNFTHSLENNGKLTGGLTGMAAGAYFGAQVGIAGGPFGAIAGTIPGAILGGLFGNNFGKTFDSPQCNKCHTTFEMPKNAKIIEKVKFFKSDQDILNKADLLIYRYNKSTIIRDEVRIKIEEARERIKKNKK